MRTQAGIYEREGERERERDSYGELVYMAVTDVVHSDWVRSPVQ